MRLWSQHQQSSEETPLACISGLQYQGPGLGQTLMDESEISASTSNARSSRLNLQVRKMRCFKITLIYLFVCLASMCVCTTAHIQSSETIWRRHLPSFHHVDLGESALAEAPLPREPAQGAELSTAWSGAQIAGWPCWDTSLWRPQTPRQNTAVPCALCPKAAKNDCGGRGTGSGGPPGHHCFCSPSTPPLAHLCSG